MRAEISPSTATGSKGRKSYAKSDVRIGEHQILNYAKESKDRLLLLHDTLKDRLDSTFSHMQATNLDRDRIRQKEDIMLLKMLVGRLQLGIYDSHLIIEICHYLQSYDQALAKCREQARRLLMENSKIRDQIDTLSEQTYAKEAQLSSTHELLGYWEFMANASATELNTNGEDLSPHELWREMYTYKEFNLRNELFEIPEPERSCYHDVCRHVCAHEMKQAIGTVKKFINELRGEAKSKHVGNILIVMSQFCIDAERYNEGIEFLKEAFRIYSKLEGGSSGMACTIKCRIAAIHWLNANIQEAIEILKTSVEEYCSAKQHENHPLTLRIYFNIGFFNIKQERLQLGFRIMEMALVTLEVSIQNFEDQWFDMCRKLAKCLNVHKLYKQALYISIDAYQFWMDNHTKTKHDVPLYEVAFEQNKTELICNELDVPSGEYLSMMLLEILSEMKLSFTGCLLIAAGDMIGNYIDCCKTFDQESALSEGEMHAEISRIMEKRDNMKRSQGSIICVPKATHKNPVHLSDSLKNYLATDNSQMLEFKVPVKAKPGGKGVFKMLQNLVRGK